MAKSLNKVNSHYINTQESLGHRLYGFWKRGVNDQSSTHRSSDRGKNVIAGGRIENHLNSHISYLSEALGQTKGGREWIYFILVPLELPVNCN